MTMEDLASYRTQWMSPISVKLQTRPVTVYSVPPPASGAVLAAMLNIIDTFGDMEHDNVFYQRIIETFKWAYGARSYLGDPFDDSIADFIG